MNGPPIPQSNTRRMQPSLHDATESTKQVDRIRRLEAKLGARMVVRPAMRESQMQAVEVPVDGGCNGSCQDANSNRHCIDGDGCAPSPGTEVVEKMVEVVVVPEVWGPNEAVIGVAVDELGKLQQTGTEAAQHLARSTLASAGKQHMAFSFELAEKCNNDHEAERRRRAENARIKAVRAEAEAEARDKAEIAERCKRELPGQLFMLSVMLFGWALLVYLSRKY